MPNPEQISEFFYKLLIWIGLNVAVFIIYRFISFLVRKRLQEVVVKGENNLQDFSVILLGLQITAMHNLVELIIVFGFDDFSIRFICSILLLFANFITLLVLAIILGEKRNFQLKIIKQNKKIDPNKKIFLSDKEDNFSVVVEDTKSQDEEQGLHRKLGTTDFNKSIFYIVIELLQGKKGMYAAFVLCSILTIISGILVICEHLRLVAEVGVTL